MAEASNFKLHWCASCNPELRKVVAEKATLQDLSGNIFIMYRIVLDDGVVGSVSDYFIDRRKDGE